MTWEITEPATQVFRKYNTAGSPGSGLHEPSLEDFEQWGSETEARMLLALGFSVLDRDLSTPPGSPTTGDKYIVGATPAGGWSLFAEDDIALWNGAAWENLTPAKGWQLYCEDEAVVLLFNGTAWVDPIEVAGLDIPFVAKRAASPAYMVNGTISHSRSGSAETIAIKTQAGADPSAGDPVYFVFRDVAAGTGGYVVRSVTAALSLTIPSTALLGLTDAVPGRLWWLAIDNAGTVELAVVNCLSGVLAIYPLGQFPIITTTAMGTGADSSHTPYSTTSRSSVAYSILGYSEFTLATAGTWNTAPSRVELFNSHTPLPGERVQRVRNATGALVTGTTVQVHDDTIPQSGEGVEVMTQSITPTSGANLLHISALVHLATSAASGTMIASLFKDSGASAVAACTSDNGDAANVALQMSLDHQERAAAVTSTTYKVRAGNDAAGTTSFNGISGARRLGGVMNSHLSIDEIMA